MIKSNELRIGNLVSGINDYKEYPSPITIVGVSEQFAELKAKEDTSGELITFEWGYDLIYPIPLSPEILEKIGKIEKDGWVYLQRYHRVCCAEVTNLCNFSIGVAELGSEDMDWFVIALPEYLHQLQNLYFTLTGEELPVKL